MRYERDHTRVPVLVSSSSARIPCSWRTSACNRLASRASGARATSGASASGRRATTGSCRERFRPRASSARRRLEVSFSAAQSSALVECATAVAHLARSGRTSRRICAASMRVQRPNFIHARQRNGLVGTESSCCGATTTRLELHWWVGGLVAKLN